VVQLVHLVLLHLPLKVTNLIRLLFGIISFDVMVMMVTMVTEEAAAALAAMNGKTITTEPIQVSGGRPLLYDQFLTTVFPL
jgi:hypothetical protein